MNDISFATQSDLLLLQKNNLAHLGRFKQSRLIKLIHGEEIKKEAVRDKLLDCIQVLSNYFQKVVLLRSAFCHDKKYINAARKHLQEEFGHDVSLEAERKSRSLTWDAVLEGTCSWFAWKMLTSDEAEKTVLVHLVLESSANIFFQEAQRIINIFKTPNYFKVHFELDENHEQMGYALLENLGVEKYQQLVEIQNQGWDMMDAICTRIAELVLS